MKKSKPIEPTLNQIVKGNNNSSNNQYIEVNIPKESTLSNNVEFPTKGCQEDILFYSKEVVRCYQCPLEFVLVPIINVFSAIAGNAVILKDGKFENAPLHNIIVVAPSGSNKSQPMKYALKPLLDLNYSLYEDWKKKKNTWSNDLSEKKGEEPNLKQVVISDSTPEARNKALCNNTTGILEYSDEMATKMNNVGRYNNAKDLSPELSLWDGTDIIINRKGEDPMVIQRPFCSVMGTIQPAVINSVFGAMNLVHSGYVQRCLWIYPDICTFPNYNDYKLAEEKTEAYNKSIKEFYEVIQHEKYLEVILSKEAKESYKEYYNTLQEKKRTANNDCTRAIYSKLSIQCLRWGLSLHILEWAMKTVENKFVLSSKTMDYAIACMKYFEHTALKVQALINGDAPLVKLTKTDVLKKLLEFYPDINQTQLAKVLKLSQQYISRLCK